MKSAAMEPLGHLACEATTTDSRPCERQVHALTRDGYALCHGHLGASRRVIDSRAEVLLGVLPPAPKTLEGWDPQVDALRRAQQSVKLFLRRRIPLVVAELVEIRDSLA